MAEDLRSAEAQAEQYRDNLQAVFAARALYREALKNKNLAESEAVCVAPEGYLFRITAKSNGSLTRIHNGHKPDPWYYDLKEDQVVYAPRIDSTRHDGHAIVTVTSWMNGPMGEAFRLDGHEPVRINNGDFDLGLISVEEYSTRRLSGDLTLYHTPTDSVTETTQ